MATKGHHYLINIPVFAGEGEETKELYAKVMNGEWDDVIQMYKGNREVFQNAIITNPKQTALHIAISSSLTDVVRKLLDNIDALAIRKMTDNREENPLHLAASLGQFETCKRLVDKDPELIGAKNVEGETPLFLAVLHGKKEAFYALHPKNPITGLLVKHAKAHCKRNDGNTILHGSIRGEYFQLAYQIIHWYPELIKDVNEDGQMALHLLAQNPSAFRSRCYLGPVDVFIYSCVIVDLDEVETHLDFMDERRTVPENYQTCLDLWNTVLTLIVSWARAWKDIKSDICKIFSRNVNRLPVKNTRYFQVGKIKAMKQKHKLTYQIMKRLVRDTEFWVYGGTGLEPDIRRAKESILLPSIDPDDYSTEVEDVSATTSKNPPWPDGFEDGKKWKEMMRLMQKIIPGIQGKIVLVEAEKIRSKDSEDDDLWTDKYFSPILVAAKMGIVEMVEEVLNIFPIALYDEDSDKKNVLMLAAENGQAHVVDRLRKMYPHELIIYQKVDNKGNTAIHLAATFGKNRPWRISSAAIQMQWDLKWYNFIESSMPTNLRAHRNKEGKTSMEVFEETHEGIIKDGVQWLNSTSASCSVVAALIASVAYASAATVPGGDNQNNGIPILKGEPSFDTFIIASLVALCFSVTSLTMFLSVLTSNYMMEKFLYNLPTKLLLGLTSLFISIGAMLVSFCAGHFFNIGDRNRNTGLPVFAIICLPVSAYVLTQFHLLIDLVKAPF